MAMISFEGGECWVCPRWAFARLVRSASMFTRHDGDLEVLQDAVTRDLLDLPQLDEGRADRLVLALRQGAGWLRAELVAEKSTEEADRELAMALTPLATQLSLWLKNRAAARRRAAAVAPVVSTHGRLASTHR